MTVLSQKAGVFNAVTSLLADTDRVIESGIKVELTTSERKSVVLMLCEATEAGTLERKSNKSNQPLPKYWEQTLSNWLRKDDRLNGKPGEKYEAQNPGSRTGVGDAELKELKKLLAQVTAAGNAENIAAVQKHVDARLAVVEAEKAKKLEVDLTKIDPALLAMLGYVKVEPSIEADDEAS